MVTGGPGVGKSVTGRLTARHLEGLRDVVVASFQHPQSNIADFYRELGELFGVPLRPHNRWAGFKELRARFCATIEGTTMRPILIVDEAQEMNHIVLSELRLLSSTRFALRLALDPRGLARRSSATSACPKSCAARSSSRWAAACARAWSYSRTRRPSSPSA